MDNNGGMMETGGRWGGLGVGGKGRKLYMNNNKKIIKKIEIWLQKPLLLSGDCAF